MPCHSIRPWSKPIGPTSLGPRSHCDEQWTAATEAHKGGNLLDAITKGSAVKTKAAELLTMLGMPVPDALKG